jgi:hypothetical protein
MRDIWIVVSSYNEDSWSNIASAVINDTWAI